MATPILRLRTVLFVAATCTAVLAGCGGGDGAAGPTASGGEVAFAVNWERPGSAALLAGSSQEAADTFTSPIPPSVSAIGFILRPAAPAAPCCIAVLRGSQAFLDRRIVLANVASGLGSLEVYGFPTPFAPSNGVSAVCPTNPGGQGVACSGNPNTLPSYGSDEIPVDVVAGERNFVTVDVQSLPFLLDLDPEDGGRTDNHQPEVNFTVVDAVNSINPSVSIRLKAGQLVNQAAIETAEECQDGSSALPDCSAGGALEVRGLRITSQATQHFASGGVELRIQASNTPFPVPNMESNTTFIIDQVTSTTSPSTSGTTTSTVGETTTTTLGVPEVFCLKFRVNSAVDLVGISYTASYGATGGDFLGSGENVSCSSLVPDNSESTLASFNDQQTSILSTAIISAETFSGPVDLALCEFEQVPPLNLAAMAVQVTEATAPDLSPATATVVVEETPCPL